MRSSVRSRLAPPNSDSMFSIVSTESHLVCTIFVQPRVFSRHSISPKRSEKDAVRLHPPLTKMSPPERHRMEAMPLPQVDSGHSQRRSRVPSHQRTDENLGAGRRESQKA